MFALLFLTGIVFVIAYGLFQAGKYVVSNPVESMKAASWVKQAIGK